MAPKGTKRAGQVSKTAQPAKVQKKVKEKKVSDPLMEGLTDAIQRAELPKDCKEMLLHMTPYCFSVPTEERHELQNIIVRQVGEVIAELHSQMTKDVQEATTALESAEAEKTSLETTAVEAKSQLTVASETVQSKEAGLQAATNLAGEKQVLLEAARDAQTKGDAVLVAVKQEKETCEQALTNSTEQYKILEPLLPKLQLDESLLFALPSTCQKKPCDRGPFDDVVMDQLEKALNTHTAALSQQLEDGAAGAAERAAAVQAAELDLSAANEAKETANKHLCTAQATHAEAVEFLKSSEQAVTDCKVRNENIIKARDDKVKAQTNFENGNMSCFTQLRDKSTAPKEVTEATDVEMTAKVAFVEETGNAPVTQAGA